MPIRKYTLTPPFATLPGDTVTINGGLAVHKRASVIVGVRILADMVSSLVTQEKIGSNVISTLYLEEESAMRVTLTVDSIPIAQNGTIRLNTSIGGQLEFPDAASVNAAISSALTTNLVQIMALAYWAARNPALDDPSLVVGKTFQLDLSLELGQLLIGEA